MSACGKAGTILDAEEMGMRTTDSAARWPAETFLCGADGRPNVLNFKAFGMH